MPDQVTNYKCPKCGGPLHFDSAEQKLKCDYCDSVFEVAEIEEMYADANLAAIEANDVYAAPEQRDGSYDVDARTDIYTIGRILEELSPHQSFFLSKPKVVTLHRSFSNSRAILGSSPFPMAVPFSGSMDRYCPKVSSISSRSR